MALPANITELLERISLEAPQLFKNLLEFIANLYDQNTTVNIPSGGTASGPLDVMSEDGSGSHVLTSTGVPEEVRIAIRKGVAEGIVREKALEWLKGLMMGLSIASAGAGGPLGGIVSGIAGAAGTAAATGVIPCPPFGGGGGV